MHDGQVLGIRRRDEEAVLQGAALPGREQQLGADGGVTGVDGCRDLCGGAVFGHGAEEGADRCRDGDLGADVARGNPVVAAPVTLTGRLATEGSPS